MSDPTLKLGIESHFDDRGTSAALRAMQQLQQAQQKAMPKSGGDGGAAAFKATGQAAQQAERDALRYATAMAQAQKATGDTAGSVETLRNALGQMTPNTIEAHQATTRLAGAQNALQKELTGGATYAQQFGQAMTSSLMGIIGPAALAGTAIAAVGKAGELIQLGAQADQTRQRFDGLAQSAGTTGDALLSALRQASAGTISDLNLELAANRAQLLGVADSAEEFATLMEIARARAQDMGISTTQAFNDLVTGLGRGSALILDNLGITVSVTEANKAYAAQLGKNASALTEAEQKQALINAVLEQGQASLAKGGAAIEGNAAKIERLAATWENLKAAIGGGIADTVLPTADLFTSLTGALDGTRESWLRLSDATAVFLGLSPEVVAKNHEGAAALWDAAAGADAYTASINGVAVEMEHGTASGGSWADAANQGAQASLAAGQATEAHAQQVAFTTTAMDTQLQAMGMLSTTTEDATLASMADAAAKEEQAAKIDLLKAQTEQAITAFMELHPNISASGAASLLAASNIDPLLQQLILARIRAYEARDALAAFNALQGLKVSAPVAFAERHGGMEGGALTPAARAAAAKEQLLNQQIAEAKKKSDADAARNEQILATGTHDQKLALLKSEYDLAVRQHGAESAEAIRAQTKVQQEAARKASGGGGGRGGAPKGADGLTAAQREKQAASGAGKLEDIARTSGNKLADIDQQTQEKLLAIDEKYARQRAEAQRALMDDIARTNADTDFDQQLNDFDKFQKDMSDDQKAALEAREAAEAEYNTKVTAAQEEARQEAESGDAQLARDILKARTEQAAREKEIAERTAEARRAGGDKAAVAAEAQQATEAARRAAETDIAIARAAAAERAGAAQAEKDAVIAQAEEQRNKVIAAAEESASKVKGAADSQKSAVISALRAQADAAKDWANTIKDAASQAQDAMGGVTGPPATGTPDEGTDTPSPPPPAPGQSILGGAGIRAGSASGGGGAFGDDVLQTLRDVVAFLEALLPQIKHHNNLVKDLRTYSHTLISTIDVLGDLINLRKALAQPIPPLKVETIAQLVNEFNLILVTLANLDTKAAKQAALFAHLYQADQVAIELLQKIADLRTKLQGVDPNPVNLDLILTLAQEAQQVALIVQSQIVTANKKLTTNLKLWAEIVGASIGVLNDVSDLRNNLAENAAAPPIDEALVRSLAAQAAQIATIVNRDLVPYSEGQAEALSNWAGAIGSAVAILKDTLDLRKELGTGKQALGPLPVELIKALAQQARQVGIIVAQTILPSTEESVDGFDRYAQAIGNAISILKDTLDLRKELGGGKLAIGPLPVNLITALAQQARQVAQIAVGTLVPSTEEQAAAFERYASTVGAAVGTLKDVSDLRKTLAEGTSAGLNVKDIERLADEARRITQIVLSRAIPASEEQAAAAQRFADTTGAAVSVLKDTLELPAKMFVDYQSPTDAQIGMVVKDADRIARALNVAASKYSTDGLEAVKAYGDALGSVFTAFKDELIFAQSLATDDYRINPRQLASFEADTMKVIATAGRLGSAAAALPAGDIGALNGVVSALNATSDMWIKLASVPFGNLGAIGGRIGGGGVTLAPGAIVINTLPGQSPKQIAELTLGMLHQQIKGRR